MLPAFFPAGSGRLEVKSSDPSGRKRGLPSPSAERVSRRAGPPRASIRQMLVRYFFLSALSVCTAAASQVPSGASRSAPTRGIATKSLSSWNGVEGVEGVEGVVPALTVAPRSEVDKPRFGSYPHRACASLAAQAGLCYPALPGPAHHLVQLASVIMAAPTVALVDSSIRMRPPVVRFLA